jgi:hemerythrin
MKLLVWDHRLELGIKVIDDQHKRLFEKIDELLVTAGRQGSKKDVLDGFMAYLSEYVDMHFRTEEKWMLDSGYPEYLGHKVAHDIFRAELDLLMTDYRSRRYDKIIIDRVCETATNWLSRHIYQQDMAMATWFRDQGVAARIDA